jgi:hypothetical protein
VYPPSGNLTAGRCTLISKKHKKTESMSTSATKSWSNLTSRPSIASQFNQYQETCTTRKQTRCISQRIRVIWYHLEKKSYIRANWIWEYQKTWLHAWKIINSQLWNEAYATILLYNLESACSPKVFFLDSVEGPNEVPSSRNKKMVTQHNTKMCFPLEHFL